MTELGHRSERGAQALSLGGALALRHKVQVHGEGEHVIVFSHGLGTDQTAWTAVVERLPTHFTTLLFDLPGAGPLLPEDFNPEDYNSVGDYADDLLNLLDEIGVERCTYVGHSVSGMIGVLASIEEPARFDKLVLLNASPRYLNDIDYTGGWNEAELEALFSSMSANYQAWVAGFAPLAVKVDMPGAIADFSSGLLSMRPDITAKIAKMIFTSDLRRVLPQVSVPTLLIHAREDVAVPESVATYLERSIKGSRLAWIKTAGHMPHLAAPEEVAAILRDNLAH